MFRFTPPLLVLVSLSLLPAMARACPACVGQARVFDSRLWLLGIFLAVPFATVTIVIWSVRRLLEASE